MKCTRFTYPVIESIGFFGFGLFLCAASAFASCDVSTEATRSAVNDGKKAALVELFRRRGLTLLNANKTSGSPTSPVLTERLKAIFGVDKQNPQVPCEGDLASAQKCTGGIASILAIDSKLPLDKVNEKLSAYYRLYRLYVDHNENQPGERPSDQGLVHDTFLANTFKEKLNDTDYWISGTTACPRMYNPPYIYLRASNKKCDDPRPDPETEICQLNADKANEVQQYNTNRIEGVMMVFESYAKRHGAASAPRKRLSATAVATNNEVARSFTLLESNARKDLEATPKMNTHELSRKLDDRITQLEEWLKTDERKSKGPAEKEDLERDAAFVAELKANLRKVDFWMAGTVYCLKPLPAAYVVALKAAPSCTHPSSNRTTTTPGAPGRTTL